MTICKIDANVRDGSGIPKCLQSWRAIQSRWVYYIPAGYDDLDVYQSHLLGVAAKFRDRHPMQRFAILAIGGMDIVSSQFVHPIQSGIRQCSVALGPMLIDATAFASIPASKAACLSPWTVSEELAISVLGARVLRRSPCYVATRSELEIDATRYRFQGWKEIWDRCAAEEKRKW